VQRLERLQLERTAITADTTAVVIRMNTAPGSARVNIRIEHANAGAPRVGSLMLAGLRRFIVCS
jgi:hypothetical protein